MSCSPLAWVFCVSVRGFFIEQLRWIVAKPSRGGRTQQSHSSPTSPAESEDDEVLEVSPVSSSLSRVDHDATASAASRAVEERVSKPHGGGDLPRRVARQKEEEEETEGLMRRKEEEREEKEDVSSAVAHASHHDGGGRPHGTRRAWRSAPLLPTGGPFSALLRFGSKRRFREREEERERGDEEEEGVTSGAAGNNSTSTRSDGRRRGLVQLLGELLPSFRKRTLITGRRSARQLSVSYLDSRETLTMCFIRLS